MERWIRELGGPHVDLWTAAARAEAVARGLVDQGMPEARARREAARQVVSASLVESVRSGDRAAADRLVAVWLEDVVRWARFHAGSGVVAEDVAHDSLVRMLEHLPRLREPERFRPWLWGLVWRVLKEHERRARWRRWAWLPRGEPDLEQQVHAAERVAQVGEVLRTLTLDQRALLFLAYVEGHSRPRIAKDLGLAEGTLNRKLTEARAAFASAAVARGLDGGSDLARLWEET